MSVRPEILWPCIANLTSACWKNRSSNEKEKRKVFIRVGRFSLLFKVYQVITATTFAPLKPASIFEKTVSQFHEQQTLSLYCCIKSTN